MLLIEVLFPFALPKLYTYAVPSEYASEVAIGKRVEAELRNKIYTGLIHSLVQSNEDDKINSKFILSIVDDHPVIGHQQLALWKWISDYYLCTLGEVMEASLPSGLKLNSETTVLQNDAHHDMNESTLSYDESIVAEALENNKAMTIEDIRKLLNKKNIHKIIKSLLEKNIILVKEDLVDKYKPKTISVVKLKPEYTDEDALNQLFQKLKRSEKQSNVILTHCDINKDNHWIPLSELSKYANVDTSVIRALVKKDILQIENRNISRLSVSKIAIDTMPPLNEEQEQAYKEIGIAFKSKKPVLLHGVTGSGKTRIYQELIKNTISLGKQVLYILPEIALTSQIIDRLTDVFGNEVLLYHSKINDNNRIEIWNEVLQGKKIILAARSGIFLPFVNLGLIIVDEEHDPSYKQEAPRPYYHARDMALVMGQIYNSNIILGSATPSLESYYNASQGRYKLVKLLKRHGDVKLPQLTIVDQNYELKTGRYKIGISVPLQKEIKKIIADDKQAILFLNRRGYVPTVLCKSCGWTAVCSNCDINLTYHQYQNILICHYCNYTAQIPPACKVCGNTDLKELGQGTEKIEHLTQQYIPEAKTVRLDMDTARTKAAIEKTVTAFARKDFNIMIGTQMVAKGFDFADVAVVGILNADASLHHPDYKANERTYQLITQVAGRAGRRHIQGKVYIQTHTPNHPVIEEILLNDYEKFYQREIKERKQFGFPPFVKLIRLEISHKEKNNVIRATLDLSKSLQKYFSNRVSGPITPSIERLKNKYHREILIKMEKDSVIIKAIKHQIQEEKTKAIASDKSLKINIVVDV